MMFGYYGMNIIPRLNSGCNKLSKVCYKFREGYPRIEGCNVLVLHPQSCEYMFLEWRFV